MSTSHTDRGGAHVWKAKRRQRSRPPTAPSPSAQRMYAPNGGLGSAACVLLRSGERRGAPR